MWTMEIPQWELTTVVTDPSYAGMQPLTPTKKIREDHVFSRFEANYMLT